jgi:uncharacterized protein (TIGR01777 family)
METVLITGGTGLIGKSLGQALLDKGYKVIILSRQTDNKTTIGNLSYANWNVEQQTIDKNAIATADHIIHLAGAGVAERRWTKKRKKEIADSRVNSSRLIVNALHSTANKIKTIVSASAIGWYGADPVIPNNKPFTEDATVSNDFLGNTCRQWEESIQPVSEQGKRLVILRTGIVLSRDGGALKEFLKPLRFSIAAVLGSGKQIISWIHIEDLVNMFIAAIENENMTGIYNAVAPGPVSNKELTLQLAKSRSKYFISVHIPSFVLKLVLGEMSIEILKSTTVSSKKIQMAGFHFHYPEILPALKSLS